MNKYNISLALLLVTAALLLSYNIGKPFWGQFDWTGAWFGTIAKNYLEISPENTKMAAITVSGTQNPKDWQFYNHYTSFFPILIGLSMSIFGSTEAAIRIVPLIFSLLTLLVFYKLCQKFISPLVGIFGILAVIFSPMFVYYGKLPVHEQAVLFFSLTGLYFYLSWLSTSKKSDYIKIFVFLGLGFLTSWTGAYMLFLLTIHLFLTKRWQVFKLWPAYMVAGLITGFHLFHILVSSDIHDFKSALAERSSGGNIDGAEMFTPVSFLVKQLKWFLVLYGRPIALLALISLALQIIRSIFKKSIPLSTQICLVFFFWGFFEWFLVPRIAWIHDYMLIYFLPFVALSVGIVFARLFNFNKIIGSIIILLVVSGSLFSSLPFTGALINSKDQTEKLYNVAKEISAKTKYGDRVLVVIPDIAFEKRYPSHYLNFYSNRYVKYSTNKVDENAKDYNLVIVPEKDNFLIYESN